MVVTGDSAGRDVSPSVARCHTVLRDLEQDTKIAGLQCFIFKMRGLLSLAKGPFSSSNEDHET